MAHSGIMLPTLLGSRPVISDEPTKLRRPAPAALEIPEESTEGSTAVLDSPRGLRIKNTFIEGAAPLSPSLESFYRERVVHTCPSKHAGRCLSLLQELEDETPSTPVSTPLNIQTPCSVETRTSDSLMQAQASYDWYESTYLYPPAHFGQEGMFMTLPAGAVGLPHVDQTCGLPEPSQLAVGAPRTVLSLADALEQEGVGTSGVHCGLLVPDHSLETQQACPGFAGGQDLCRPINTCVEAQMRAQETMPQYLAPTLENIAGVSNPPSGPAPGSLDLPSVGSIDHAMGRCKPCAFMHTKGCENDLACQFCHLCGPDVRKERKLEKVQQRREANRARKEKKLAIRHLRTI